ncbi:MAG: 1-acyl-sn-glycerol-3-phosphate acyltransferase, partial [Myxococcales bacterium]|nr:1-acyl-sn-glycerol-3-phosphate acyltransferase [Myxococcales bacterium]
MTALAKVSAGATAVMSWRRFIGLCLVWCPSSVVTRALTGPKLPQTIMRRWCEGIVRDVGIEIVAEGLEKIAGRPSVIVANHCSLLDIPVLGSVLDIDYRWVAKRQLFRVPLVGWHLWACGHIAVDRAKGGNLSRMQEQIERVLEAGGSVVFFAEGTRSPDGALQPFRGGAFISAVAAGVPVLPIVLEGTEQLMVKGSLKFPRGSNKRVRVRVLDRIEAPPADDPRQRADALRDLTRARMVEALDALRGGA